MALLKSARGQASSSSLLASLSNPAARAMCPIKLDRLGGSGIRSDTRLAVGLFGARRRDTVPRTHSPNSQVQLVVRLNHPSDAT